MNLILAAPVWLVALLFVALAAAALEDVWRLRIANVTCGLVVVLAVIAAGFAGFTLNMWQNALVFVLILIFGTFAFSAGLLGGGDVKLLASVGLWTDLNGAVWLIAAVFIAGGFLGAMFIVGRKLLGPRAELARQQNRIPYGLAIVAGAVIIAASRVEQSRQPHALLPLTILPAR